MDILWDTGALDVTLGADLPADWAAEAKTNSDIWLYVDILGLEHLGNKALTVTPTLENVGQSFELSNGSIVYNA